MLSTKVEEGNPFICMYILYVCIVDNEIYCYNSADSFQSTVHKYKLLVILQIVYLW